MRNARAKGRRIGRPPQTQLSSELRADIANAYQFGGTSRRLLAKTFGTSLATVQRCVRVVECAMAMTSPARHRMNSNLQPVDLARYYSVLIRKPLSCVMGHDIARY